MEHVTSLAHSVVTQHVVYKAASRVDQAFLLAWAACMHAQIKARHRNVLWKQVHSRRFDYGTQVDHRAPAEAPPAR